MHFWVDPEAERDRRVVKIYEHCCCEGDVAVAQIASMPPAGDRALEAELAVELSPAGEIVRRWSLPIDSIIVAVSESVLVVPDHETRAGARAFAISETGGIRWTTIPPSTDPGRVVECPPLADFGESAYLRCFEFKDRASGALRRIAYQGPCT